MVKKAELKVGLKLRKKSWKNDYLYVRITAIGEKHIILKYSPNCEWQANRETVHRDFEIWRDWEIFKGQEEVIIGKKYKIKDGIVDVMDIFYHPHFNKEYVIYSSDRFVLGKMMSKEQFIEEYTTNFWYKYGKEEKMVEELKDKGFITWMDGRLVIDEEKLGR